MEVKENKISNQLKMEDNNDYKVFTFIQYYGEGAEVYLAKKEWLGRMKEVMEDFDSYGVGRTNKDEKGNPLTCRNLLSKEVSKGNKNVTLICQGVSGLL